MMGVSKQPNQPKKPMSYQSTTGLELQKFMELQDRITQILESRRSPHQLPGGRPVVLSLHDQLYITLVLLRQNIRQGVLADLFGVSQPTISRTYRSMMPLISQATVLDAPDIRAALRRGESLIVDGTDVPVRKHKPAIRTHYSGKKRKHCLNVQAITTLSGQLMHLGEPVPGSHHDRKAFTDTGLEELLAGTPYLADLGYQGTEAIIPYKKRANEEEHSDHNKAFNDQLASIRWAVEQGIGHLKNWNILSEIYRGVFHELPAVIQTVARLEFFKLSASGTQL